MPIQYPVRPGNQASQKALVEHSERTWKPTKVPIAGVVAGRTFSHGLITYLEAALKVEAHGGNGPVLTNSISNVDFVIGRTVVKYICEYKPGAALWHSL